MFGVFFSRCRGRWLLVRLGRGALWVLWLAFFFVPMAMAQSETDAAVRGRLTDARGQPVSAAVVRLRPADSGESSVMAMAVSVRTDARGGFVLLGLTPGAWEAEVLLPGSMGWTGEAPLPLEAGDVKEGELSLGDDFSLKFSVNSADKEGGGATGLEVSRGAGDGPAGKLGGTAGQATPLSELPVEDRQWEAVEEISPAAHDATLAGGGSAQDATEEDEGGDGAVGGRDRVGGEWVELCGTTGYAECAERGWAFGGPRVWRWTARGVGRRWDGLGLALRRGVWGPCGCCRTRFRHSTAARQAEWWL